MKEYEVTVNHSWTVDYVSWDCPRCGHFNEFHSNDENDNVCQECELVIPNYKSPMGYCDGDIQDYSWTEDSTEFNCPNCGITVEEEGQYCEECSKELGVE